MSFTKEKSLISPVTPAEITETRVAGWKLGDHAERQGKPRTGEWEPTTTLGAHSEITSGGDIEFCSDYVAWRIRMAKAF